MNDGFFRLHQPVKHVNRKLHDARFVGYTETGRIVVRYNAAHPFGVAWSTSNFDPKNILKAGEAK
jgi:hypothetical protein